MDDPIVRKLMKKYEESLYEMANVSRKDTGLPYEIWIDSEGSNRNMPHHSPRLKVDVEGDRIPVSIEDDPKILCEKKIKNFRSVADWVRKYLEVLLKHWNKELTDKEALNLLGK